MNAIAEHIRRSARAGNARDDEVEARLDAALEQTFPASDPIAVSMEPAVAGGVLTIGHSTRPVAELVALLRAHGVTQLVDVRTVPRSRHNPQFNADVLPAALAASSIDYAHAPALGGQVGAAVVDVVGEPVLDPDHALHALHRADHERDEGAPLDRALQDDHTVLDADEEAA